MCGITGFFDATSRADQSLLEEMTNTISYRGPDDSGYHFARLPYGNLGLGHRRLSVIDLSPLGHQPMHFQNLSITYNGEVYNYKELSANLLNVGYNFDSTSDTEIILKAFHHLAERSFEKLNGMFAMAIYDGSKDELTLVRDRMGVKPLFYYYDGRNIAFASELKPIMRYAHLNGDSINRQALNSYIFHGYINAPHTIFRNVYKLEPGHFLKYCQGKIEIRKYWSLPDIVKGSKVNNSITERIALDQLDEIVTSSIQYRMISDVPIGCFLSGGIDSSLVTAIMQKLSSNPIKTFTIGFQEADYNEAIFARQVASHLGTDHNERYFPIEHAKSFIESIPHFYDEPFADSSQLPMMMVSQLAREKVTVALSGDGGDELFCGYKRYSELYKFTPFRNISKFLRPLKAFAPVENAIGAVSIGARKFLYVDSNESIINRSYLFSQFYLNGLVKDNQYLLDDKFFEILSLAKDNIQLAYMLQDMVTYLPDDILTKVDRATMSVGLEGREPLLDYRLIEYSFTIPHHLKFKDGVGKYLLKRLAKRYIPSELLDRPKMGFGVPIYRWLRGDLHYLIEKYLSSDYLHGQNIFDHKKMKVLIHRFTRDEQSEFFAKMIWHLIVFQMWYDKYLNKTNRVVC